MVGILAFLFLAGAVIMLFLVFVGMVDAEVMPFCCPACFADGDERIRWYRVVDRAGRVRCRSCGARFKEHPDGSLVADRDP